MRKLKLELLQVESFETVAPMPEARGTVQGHRPNTDGCPIQPGTGVSDCIICVPMSNGCESIQICKDTEWLDCTYSCTCVCYTNDPRANSCQLCWVTDHCTVEAG